MSSNFRVFRTYAGTIKRKEDFFTYYLANALDYIYRNYPFLFSAVKNESLRVTMVVQDRLQEQAKSAEVGRLGQCLENVNLDQGVTAEVRARVEAPKAAIESSARGSLRAAVVDEFIFSVPDETSRLLLSRFIQGIGLKENPYLTVVSDATQAITALGFHVWSANAPKGKHISFLTLRRNMIVIPLSK